MTRTIDMHEIRRVAERMVNMAWDAFVFDDNADELHEEIIRQLRKHVVNERGCE